MGLHISSKTVKITDFSCNQKRGEIFGQTRKQTSSHTLCSNFPKLVFGHLQSYFLLCSSFSREFIFDTTMMKNLFPLLFLLFFVTSIHGLQVEENSLMTFTPDTNARGIYGNHVGALRIGTYKSLSLSTALTGKYLFWAIIFQMTFLF